MKALVYDRYGGPEVLSVREIPDPTPGPGEVLIAVHAASVAPGDTKVRAGLLREHFKVPMPSVPGRDGSGVVVATGDAVDYVSAGDEVVFITGHEELGGAAELVARGRDRIAPKPRNLSHVEAAALAHAGVCAVIALEQVAKVQPGMKVLIHGASGAIGCLAVQLAKHLGAEVAGTCRSTNKAFVAAHGADRVIDYDQEDFAAVLSGYDVVLDLVGGDVHRRSYATLKPGGALVYLMAAPIEDLSAQHGVRLMRAHIHDDVETLRAVCAYAEAGVLKPPVAAVLALAEGAAAHRMVETGQASRGRVVVNIR